MAGNAVLVGIAGIMVKKWMDKLESRDEQNSIETKEAARKLADDLKQSVIDHKEEIKSTQQELNNGLNNIYDQLRIANGRTAKLEGAILTVKAVCEERHGK